MRPKTHLIFSVGFYCLVSGVDPGGFFESSLAGAALVCRQLPASVGQGAKVARLHWIGLVDLVVTSSMVGSVVLGLSVLARSVHQVELGKGHCGLETGDLEVVDPAVMAVQAEAVPGAGGQEEADQAAVWRLGDGWEDFLASHPTVVAWEARFAVVEHFDL